MVLRATSDAMPALRAIQATTSAQSALRAIEQDQALTLQLDVSVSAAPELTNVEGWTYLHLFGADPDADPIATITDAIDTEKLAGWARDLGSAEITIWMNRTMIGGSEGRMIGIALHEWELHARALYDLYKELRGVRTAAGQAAAAKALETLTAYVKAGVYSAGSQHAAPELRGAQMMAVFRLACAKVAAGMRGTTSGKRKTTKAELDPDSVEYAALMTVRRDVLNRGTGLSLDDAKQAYAGGLAVLRTDYGQDVVNEVTNQFEMED